MIKKTKTNKKINNFDRFLKYFPICGLIFTILFIILIWIFSYNNIEYAPPNYQNVKTFTEVYEIPFKFLLILLTIWGILVAYKNYLQTKELFLIENRPWVTVGNEINIIENKDNYTVKIGLINFGKSPGLKIRSIVRLTINNKRTIIKNNKLSNLTLFPGAITDFEGDLSKNILIKKNPIIKIDTFVKYYDTNNDLHVTQGKAIYDFNTRIINNFGDNCT